MIVIPGLLLWLLFVAAETEHSGSWETEDLADHLEVLGETHKTASVEVSNLTVTFPAYADMSRPIQHEHKKVNLLSCFFPL